MYLSEWKIVWIGACSILRTSVDLFKLDAKSCINLEIRKEIRSEWDLIAKNKNDHPIFWEFLRKERDNIMHEYQWTAYEVWLDEDGFTQAPRMSLLSVQPENMSMVLLMRDGHYKGRNSLDLLKESAEWVKQRIFGAINRAGFDPEENRRIGDFQVRPKVRGGLLAQIDSENLKD